MAKPSKYAAEVILVDNNGKRYNAKIVGYNGEGKLPAIPEGAKIMTAEEAGLHLKTTGVDFEEGVPKQGTKLVDILEYRTTETKSGRKGTDGKELVGFRPYVDLLVNVGSDKTGEKWCLMPSVSYAKHVRGSQEQQSAIGAPSTAKRYFIELPESKKEAPKQEPEAPGFAQFDALTDEDLRKLATDAGVNLGNTTSRHKIIQKLIDGKALTLA